MTAVKYEVSSRYEQLMIAIEDAANQANAGIVHRRQSMVGCFHKHSDNVTFRCYLVMENWKWRAAKTSENVTIVVQAKETLSKDARTLIESVVGVSYFEMIRAKPEVLHSVHYDFGPPLECHPTFHAQFTAQPFIPPSDEISELNCDLQFGHSTGRCFKNARIPTSDMTFASVLLCLAADHIGGQFFTEFKAKVLEIQRSMPKPSYETLRKSLGTDRSRLGSSHWFAHMP